MPQLVMPKTAMKKTAFSLYALICYAATLGTFGYLAAFLGNFWAPRVMDGPAEMPALWAALVNLGLLVLFGIQHSVMARPAFKAWWTRIVPEPIERATYCLFSCLALGVLFLLWQPIGPDLWRIESGWGLAAIYSLYALGWAVVLGSTFLINHFDLTGLRQVFYFVRDRPAPELKFSTPVLYRWVRHPIYVGWMIVVWSTPVMTLAHVILAAGMTAYILLAIPFEERDLVHYHGERYEDYQREVPRLVPGLRPSQTRCSALAS